MSSPEILGNIEGAYDGKQIEWKVDNFSAVLVDEAIIESPRFSFGNTSWYIRLWLSSTSKHDCMALILAATKKHGNKLDYELGFKRKDNNVELLGTGNLEEKSVCSDYCYIELSEISRRKCELTPRDELTITCYLRHGNILPTISKPKTLKSLDTLSENFANLFYDKESCDVTLRVEDTNYPAHKTVLIARSSVFRDMFRCDTSITFTINNCDQESFEIFLKFLYMAELEELTSSQALSLYKTSEEYKVQELTTFCSEYLTENLTVGNLCDIAATADKYKNAKLLLAVQHFFNKNLNKVLVTSEWEDFMKEDPNLANKLMVEMSTKVKVVE